MNRVRNRGEPYSKRYFASQSKSDRDKRQKAITECTKKNDELTKNGKGPLDGSKAYVLRNSSRGPEVVNRVQLKKKQELARKKRETAVAKRARQTLPAAQTPVVRQPS